MANGDLTKTTEYDKIEVVNSWNIQVRAASVVSEEQADGSLTELSRSFHRHVLTPFNSAYTAAVEEVKDSDGNVTTAAADASWAHTATDISGEAAQVQAISNAAWTDAVKNAYKAFTEAQPQQ